MIVNRSASGLILAAAAAASALRGQPLPRQRDSKITKDFPDSQK